MRIQDIKTAMGGGGSRQAYTPPVQDRFQSILDAPQAGLSFLQSQTAHIEREVNKILYPEAQYASIIPVDTSANPWATAVTYYSMDATGAANWFNGYGQDIPNVGVKMEQFNTGVHMAAIGYDFTIQEIEQARMAGVSLAIDKAEAARLAYEKFVDTIAINGDASKNFSGFAGYTGITPVNVPNDGTGTSRLFSTKSPDQILRDLNEPLISIYSGTLQTEMADTLLLPPSTFAALASTRVTDGSRMVLDLFRESNVYTATTGRPLQIIAVRALETAGATVTKRMIAYRKSPQVLKLHIPMPHTFFPAVSRNNIHYEVPGIFRLGGLDVRRPGAVRYRDGF